MTHAVTVGEDTVNNGFTFTADPYTIAPTTQEQTVTVQLQVNTGTAGTPSWVTVNRVTQTVTVDALLDVTGVTATVVDGAGQIVQPGTDDKYTVAMDEMEGKTYKLRRPLLRLTPPTKPARGTAAMQPLPRSVTGRGEPGSRHDSIPIANRRGGILVCRGQRHRGYGG